jgi:hypothetical protein
MVNEVKSGQTMISSYQREGRTKLLAFMGNALAIGLSFGVIFHDMV